MAWKDGTKIAKYNHQNFLRKDLKMLATRITVYQMERENIREELTNIILDYWGSMGPDCITGRLETA